MNDENCLIIAFTPDKSVAVTNDSVLDSIRDFKKKIIDYKFSEKILVLYCDSSSFFENQYAFTSILSQTNNENVDGMVVPYNFFNNKNVIKLINFSMENRKEFLISPL